MMRVSVFVVGNVKRKRGKETGRDVYGDYTRAEAIKKVCFHQFYEALVGSQRDLFSCDPAGGHFAGFFF